MKMKLIALAIMAGAISGVAHAQLSKDDEAVVDNYIASHPEIPWNTMQDKVNNIKSKNTLQEVSDYLKGNTYYDGHGTPHFPALDTSVMQPPVTYTNLEPSTPSHSQESQNVTGDQTKTDKQQTNDIANNAQHIATKVEQSTYTADQKKQAHTDDVQNGLIDVTNQRIDEDRVNLTKETDDRTQADKQQASDIANNAQHIATKVEQSTYTTDLKKQARLDDEQDGKIDVTNQRIDEDRVNLTKETDDRTQADKQQASDIANNAQHIATKVEQSTYTTDLKKQARIDDVQNGQIDITNQRIDEDRTNLAKETDERTKADKQQASDIADNTQRIDKLEANTNANFGKLKDQVDDNRQRASAAISGVAAMANIPQVTDKQEFSVGTGVGTTDGESALAVGFSARATEHVVVKASVSNDTQQNFVLGGGVSYGW